MKSNEGNIIAPETTKKVLIDPSIPIEELLGSVTTYNNVEGSDMKSLQLRTSARVFKKMRMDSAAAALPPLEKKEPEKKEDAKPEVKKPLPRPLWTQEDKNLFFEALNEYGKDFDAIHLYIFTKLKKKGLPESSIKTREQIRHLYYRTWHKISKHLKFSGEVKKPAQELYGLINYGELRKKLTMVSEKTTIKLNELVYKGIMAIRVKGKTVRIKTPMCKALRRLNQLDEKIDDIKLPPRISVELKPKDMMTWMRVQEMSQNPRVRTILPLQKRLSNLLTHMTERWKTQEVAEHEKLLSSAEQLSKLNPEEKYLENSKPRTDPPLRLTPPSDCTITVPTINISEFFTTQSICLNAYEERTGVKERGEEIWLEAYPQSKGTIKKGVKRVRAESGGEKSLSVASKPSCSTDNNENCMLDSEYSSLKVDDLIDEAVNTILALQQSQEKEEVIEEKPEIKLEEDCLQQVKKEHDIAKIKLGWTLNDCGTLTVGDLYLMFGSDAKITLEYYWDIPETFEFKKETDLLEDVPVTNTIGTDNTDNCNNYEAKDDTSSDLSATLRKLLSVAKLHYRKNIVKCPCGHVCGSPNKTNNKNKCTSAKTKPNYSDNKPIEQAPVINITPNNVTTTASMVPLIIQPQIRRMSPQTLFRRPISPNDGLRAQIDSIQRLKPRYCNRRGRRPRAKQVVVERKLPLLANKADSGRQIVQMNIISNEVATQRQLAPKIVPQITTLASSCNGTEKEATFTMETTLTPMSVTSNATTGTFTIIPLEDNTGGNLVQIDNTTSCSRVGSPTSISNLLDMALQSADNNISLVNSKDKDDDGINFVGLLAENISDSTPPTSPSRILKENENQWLNSEVVDFSLSSFLGHLESPLKTNQTNSNMANEDSRLCLSQDVDAHLQTLLTENSLDFTAKFADLAALTDVKK